MQDSLLYARLEREEENIDCRMCSGDKFRVKDGLYSWNAVLLEGNWRLVDVTRAAGNF